MSISLTDSRERSSISACQQRHDKLEKRLAKQMAQLNTKLHLYGPGDRIMVGISGGKDSYTMLHLLRRAQRIAPFKFEILAFHLDQGHPGFPVETIDSYLKSTGVDYEIEHRDTYSIVESKLEPGATPCSLCSRLRRAILYDAAVRHGCNKLALGHHREDLIHTTLLNLFYSGMLATMPPKLRSDDGRMIVIRPLAACDEQEIIEFSSLQQFPIVPCMLCGRGKDLKRERVAQLVDSLEAEIPDIRRSILAALGNVRPSHLLDTELFDHQDV